MNTNRDHFGRGVDFGPSVGAELRDVVFDPQTSGGLLIAVAPATADRVTLALTDRGIQANFVGRVQPREAALLRIG
jgi:selenide,water dikinase